MEHDTSVQPLAPVEPQVLSQRSLWPFVALMAAIVLALSVALVVVRAQDGRPRAEAGDVFDHPFQEDPLPHRGEVLLPWARTQVGAGEPRTELPDVLGAAPTVRAPDGGSFVRVEVALEEDYAIPLTALASPYVEQSEVVLRADGRDYPLSVPGGLVLDPNGPIGQDGGRWIAVEGEPTDLEVRVTVDGVTQVVDAADGSVDAGQAADLAELPSAEELQDAQATRCGEPRRLDTTQLTVTYRPALKCRVQLSLRTPYVDGVGWAQPGREFLVVHVIRPRDLSLSTGRGDATQFWDSELRFVARIGDADPVAPWVDVNALNQGTFTLQDPDDPGQVVFDVARGEPIGDLTLDLVARARLGEPFVTERREARFRWTVPGGELG